MTYNAIVILKNDKVWGVWHTESFSEVAAKQIQHEVKQQVKNLDPNCEDKFTVQCVEAIHCELNFAITGIRESIENELS